MTSAKVDCRPIRTEADLLGVRSSLRENARAGGMGIVDETKLVTAGSELARNILKYAPGGGEAQVAYVVDGGRRGVRACFVDGGPGIVDIARAMQDGYSTSGSLGLGLPGARRLVDELEIVSHPGEGTTVVIVKWIR